MARYADSLLADWINGKPATSLEHCQAHSPLRGDFEPENCAQVCNNSYELFDGRSQNLVTCGFWSAVVTSLVVMENLGAVSEFTADAEAFLKQYEPLGLELSVYQYAPRYADLIGSCFTWLYSVRFLNSYLNDGTVSLYCTKSGIFWSGARNEELRGGTSALAVTTGEALTGCLDAICAPFSLNPDLAGIGVFSSFLIQSGIVLIAVLGLLGLDLLPGLADSTRTLHTEALVAALVSFHKAQCFFSSTIQIAALILVNHVLRVGFIGKNYSVKPGADTGDVIVLNLLAISGLLPVTVVFLCISRYGRQTWYAFILTLVAVLLATATLAATFYIYTQTFFLEYFRALGAHGTLASEVVNEDPSIECGTDVPPEQLIISLCGPEILDNNNLHSSTVTSKWIWVIWVNCIIWLALCLGMMIRKVQRAMATILRENATFAVLSKYRVGLLLFLVTFGLSFAAQFVLFSIYARHAFISPIWTFGQIIAVTVWAPSLIDFIYIEYSKSLSSFHISRISNGTRWHRRGIEAHVSFSSKSYERVRAAGGQADIASRLGARDRAWSDPASAGTGGSSFTVEHGVIVTSQRLRSDRGLESSLRRAMRRVSGVT